MTVVPAVTDTALENATYRHPGPAVGSAAPEASSVPDVFHNPAVMVPVSVAPRYHHTPGIDPLHVTLIRTPVVTAEPDVTNSAGDGHEPEYKCSAAAVASSSSSTTYAELDGLTGVPSTVIVSVWDPRPSPYRDQIGTCREPVAAYVSHRPEPDGTVTHPVVPADPPSRLTVNRPDDGPSAPYNVAASPLNVMVHVAPAARETVFVAL